MSSVEAGSVAGYDIVLPPGWWTVPADPVAARQSIRQLLDAKFANMPRDTAFPVRTEVEARLRRLVANAHDIGAIDVFLSVDAVHDLPVTASCLVVNVPGTGPVSLEAIRESMAEDADEDDVVEIAGTPALRLRRRRVPPPDSADELPSTVVEHVVPVPGSHDHLAFVWSSPLEQLGDTFAALFDAIIGTLRWRWPDDAGVT